MPDVVRYEKDAEIATVRLAGGRGNAIDGALLAGLTDAFAAAAEDPAVRGVLLCSTGKLFSPGLDLPELSRFDRPTLERYIDRFNACILSMYTFRKPVLAAIRGHAIAGGMEATVNVNPQLHYVRVFVSGDPGGAAYDLNITMP